MKYDTNLVYTTHWGGGSTDVYDIEEYRVVVTYTTGSSVAVYDKDALPIEKIKPGWRHMFWNYLDAKSLTNGWWYMDETVEEAIDRNIDKIKHPDQKIWYEKDPSKDPKVWSSGTKIRYEHGLTAERVKEIEASPNFNGWYIEDKWFEELKEKYGPK